MLSKYQHAVTLMAVVFIAGGIFMYTMSYLGRMHAAMKYGPLTTAEEGAAPGMEKQVQNALTESYASIGGLGAGSNKNKTDKPADISNQSANLTNGSSVKKPGEKDKPAGKTPIMKININSASAKMLDELPGIGPVIAERIVAYREDNGFFSSPQELVNVKGIGEKKLKEILPYVRVD
jgi:competence ComEA-like helix-hairpin-helix protein